MAERFTSVREKDARAQELRAQGLTYQEIAEEMGLSSAKAAWCCCNREKVSEENLRRRSDKQEWARQHRATCPRCGGPMAVGSGGRRRGTRQRPLLCVGCRKALRREAVVARDKILEQLWAEGKSMREIAAEFGWTKGHIAVEMNYARERGANLPYRYRAGKRAAGFKFPELVR